MLTLFVITIAAAEIGLGLAIVLLVFRTRATITVDGRRGAVAEDLAPTRGTRIASTRRRCRGAAAGERCRERVVAAGGPVRGRLVGLALGRAGRATSATIAVLGATAAFVVSLVILASSPWSDPRSDSLGTVPTGWVDIDVLAVVDGLAASVAVMVAVVALLVQIYSVAYLHDDPRYPSYAALVSLFTAAMLLVVVAGDLIVLLVGWEVMGICSYFLIGHHWELPEAPAGRGQGVPDHPGRRRRLPVRHLRCWRLRPGSTGSTRSSRRCRRCRRAR